MGGGIESEFSDRLWLSLNPAFAKPNNCLRPPALNEGCGKSIFIKNPGTHILLGPVIWPSVHLNSKRSANLSYSIFVKTCARILLSPNVSQTVHVYSCAVYSWSSSWGCLFFLKLANVWIVSEDPHKRLLSQPNVQLYTLCTHVQCTCLK